MSDRLKKIAGSVVGIGISAVAVWLVAEEVDLSSTAEVLRETPLRVPPLLLLLYLATVPVRGLRWRLMMSRYSLPLQVYTKGVVAGFAGNNLLPARGGELLRMHYFHLQSGCGHVTALVSIFTEKILDGLCLLLALLLSLWWLAGHAADIAWATELTLTTGLFFCSALLVLVVARRYGLRLVSFCRGKKNRVFQLLAGLLLKVMRAVAFLRPDASLLKILALSLLVWVLEGSMFVICIWLFKPGVAAVALGFFALAVVNFGLTVPSSPGYVGVFQGMTLLALSFSGIPREQALAVSLLVHIFQFLPITLWGVWLAAREPRSFFSRRQPVERGPVSFRKTA